MPTTSAYTEIPEEQLLTMARHIKEWKDTNRVTHEKFCQRYEEAKKRLFPGENIAPMNRFRVGSIEKLLESSGSGRAAKVPRCREIEVIAHVIGRTVENLLGLETEPTMALSDPEENEQHAQGILAALSQYQREADELLGWAEFLPCSLETPEFMHAHHEAIFSNPQDVEQYDTIGLQRWKALREAGERRTWKFTQLNFLSDLEDIAYGKKEYSQISQKMRQDCLDNLLDLLQRPWNIHLIIADDKSDKQVQALKIDLRFFDSVITLDDKFVVLRDRFGITYTSDRGRHTGRWRGMLREFVNLAHVRQKEDVVDLLRRLRDPVK